MEKKKLSFEHLGLRLLDIPRHLGQTALNHLTPFTPDFVMNDVHALTPDMLASESPVTHVVVFDIEGTLENYKEGIVSNETRQLIKRLQDGGYTIAINSNAPDEERTKTVHDMFDELIGKDLVITSYDAKEAGYKHGGKPYKSMLELVEKRLEENPKRRPWKRQSFLMVGDQLLKDIWAGKNAGVKTLYVNKYGTDDHEQVARWQRYPEYLYLKSIGFKALQGTPGKYMPIDIPSAMTSVKKLHKQNFKANSTIQ